jgi:excisionase family DNA binding protein
MPKSSVNYTSPGPGKERSRLCTAKEVAATLQLNEQTVYRLARNGEIPFLRIGNKAIRFDLEGVRKTLEAKSRASERSAPPDSPLPSLPFVMLDDLRKSGEWVKPPADLALERFAVPFPSRDLTSLAYDREGP